MGKIQIKDTIAQMNKLYITYRKQHLEQVGSGAKASYVTQKFFLTDKRVREHLEGSKTIGLKLGQQGLTKFITFDVDFEDNPDKAIRVTEHLVEHISQAYGIPIKDIHVNFSGSKGYHISLFFGAVGKKVDSEEDTEKEVIQDVALKAWYEEILRDTGYRPDEVEFRATSGQGLKLPLGIHRKTNQFMHYMKYEPNMIEGYRLIPLNKEESFRYFNSIQQIDLEAFIELVLKELDTVALEPASFTEPQAYQTEQLLSEIYTGGKSISGMIEETAEVLKNNRLTYPSTRHRMTLYMAIFLKEQGNTREDTIGYINSVLLSTYDNPETRGLISKDTSREFMLSEVVRVTELTYERDYKFTTRRKDITVTEEEILEILSIEKWSLKKLALSILIHSKRYADETGEFYMAYSVMSRMGNTQNRTRLLEYVLELEKMKKATIISRGKLNKNVTSSETIYEANRYKMTLQSSELNSNNVLVIKDNNNVSLPELTSRLIDEQTAKSVIPQRQWYSHFREMYA